VSQNGDLPSPGPCKWTRLPMSARRRKTSFHYRQQMCERRERDRERGGDCEMSGLMEEARLDKESNRDDIYKRNKGIHIQARLDLTRCPRTGRPPHSFNNRLVGPINGDLVDRALSFSKRAPGDLVVYDN